jgi:protein-L-isoaspartate(D-aspartate) O-methyltransferase
MVDQSGYAKRRSLLVAELRRKGIRDERVLRAIGEVPREEFLPRELAGSAYVDRALPIGQGQTISQPYTVAFMCEALQLTGIERVLEIGTGSGYGAAVLSRLCREVFSIERLPELLAEARDRLHGLGFKNVHLYEGDGTLGLASQAPFDAIVVTAGANRLPGPYAEQLADGGRIVIPIGESLGAQSMFRFTRRGEELVSEELGRFAFVPLIGSEGWAEEEAEEG